MNEAQAHIMSIAIKMADEMMMLDEGKKTTEQYYTMAYNFVLCKFALKIQQANLCRELSNKWIDEESDA